MREERDKLLGCEIPLLFLRVGGIYPLFLNPFFFFLKEKHTSNGLVEGLGGDILLVTTSLGGANTRDGEGGADLIGGEFRETGGGVGGVGTALGDDGRLLAGSSVHGAPAGRELGGVDGADGLGRDGGGQSEGSDSNGDLHCVYMCVLVDGWLMGEGEESEEG